MPVHDTQLPAVFDEFARRNGFSVHADVIPSAVGGPLQTDLTPGEFAQEARDLFHDAREIMRNPDAITIAPY